MSCFPLICEEFITFYPLDSGTEMEQIWHWTQLVGESVTITCANPSKTFSNETIAFPQIKFWMFSQTFLKLDVFASALNLWNVKPWLKWAGWSCLCSGVSKMLTSQSLQNQLSGYLLRKFKNSNGWQKLWVVFTNFCLFFYKTHQVPTNTRARFFFTTVWNCGCMKASVKNISR